MQIKSLLITLILLYPAILWAHHTKDHLILQNDPQQVIDATQYGATTPWIGFIWFIVIFLFVIGLIRKWKNK
jgi:hypothetical protein